MRRAIDSVLTQDFSDFELIISDNASTDTTAAIAAEYAADRRVRVVRLEKTVPPIENFKNALWNARGEMFSWIAHDDFYGRPDHISRLAAKIRDGKTFAFPGVYAAHLQNDGTVVRDVRDSLAAFDGLRTKGQIVRQAIRHPSVQIYGMFRTETVREYFRFLVEDQDLVCFFEGRFIQKLLVDEPWAFVPEAHLYLGQSPANYTRRIDASPLLHSFLVYSTRVLEMYRRNLRFTALERLAIYAHIARVHGPYIVRLFASTLKQKLLRKPEFTEVR
jgi:glycosyltransferase involved in cell wall biosynthesis